MEPRQARRTASRLMHVWMGWSPNEGVEDVTRLLGTALSAGRAISALRGDGVSLAELELGSQAVARNIFAIAPLAPERHLTVCVSRHGQHLF
mmetsp:Transcript_41363/g.109589  ORF Transcript_41363/g.109589 Transcript_41363/m.109589 type:complete len:92 (-) Transcript_41363:263-538(-)